MDRSIVNGTDQPVSHQVGYISTRTIRRGIGSSTQLIIGFLCWSVLNSRIGWTQTPAAGMTPKNAAASASFWEITFSGGWVGITIQCSIIALSMAAFYLVMEQALALRRKEVMPPGLADEMRQLLSQGRLPEADQLCRSRPSPLAFVIISGLSEIDFGWTSMEKAMEDAISEQAARMYRKIEYLSVIGNLAPMLGLLGTVTGMIFAFQKVAISQGTAGAGDLAEGIYSALATTVAGLVVAIPSLGAFAVLRNRVDQLVAETAYLAQHVFAPVRRRSAKVTPRVAGPGSIPPRAPQ